MKFKFNLELKRGRSADELFSASFNDYSFSLKRSGEFRIFDWSHDGFDAESHGWKVERNGLYKEAIINLPLALALHVYKDEMSYAEAVGFDKNINMDWIIDEFDSSFDALAVASMKYHMNWSVAVCTPEQRALYEKLIKNFETELEKFTEEELDHFSECRGDSFEGFFLRRKDCETCKETFKRYNERTDAADKLQKKTRIEFVKKALPTLWS